MVTMEVILYLVGIYKYYGKKGKYYGFGDGSSGTGCGDGDGLGTRAFEDPELHVGSPAKNLYISYLKLHIIPQTAPQTKNTSLLPPREVGCGQLAEIVDAVVAGILNKVRSALCQVVGCGTVVLIIRVHTDCSVVLRP